MNRSFTKRRLLQAAVLTSALMAGAPVPVVAQTMQREHKAEFSILRLLNGGQRGGVWRAGIELTLLPGWKTYWRVPGESGVPPQFDWSASGNAEVLKVDMPVPKRFHDNYGEGIGYKSKVVFPADIKPRNGGEPVRLVLKALYAVCNDICVPVQSEVALDLNDATVRQSDRFILGTADQTLPKPDAGQAVTVTAMRMIDHGGEAALVVEIAGLAEPGETDIFAETWTSAYLRKPELLSVQQGKTSFRLKVDGLAAGTSLKGSRVRLTIAAGETGLVHDGLVQ